MKANAALVVLVLASCSSVAREPESRQDDSAIVPFVDHLVYAVPDLETAVDQVEQQLGVRAVYGGQHPGAGTHNALISLGPGRYLEIFARDPSQPEPEQPRPFGVDQLKQPRLVAWLAVGRDLAKLRADAVGGGVPLGEIKSGSRLRPDGIRIAWQFTDPWVRVADGLVPPFIDWLGSPHPSQSAPAGLELVALRAEHPSPKLVQSMLAKLGLPLRVEPSTWPALVATLKTPKGTVELR